MKKKKRKERTAQHSFVVFFWGDRLANHQEKSLTVEEHANGRELEEDPPRNRDLAAIANKVVAFRRGFRFVSPGWIVMESRGKGREVESR